MKFLDCQRVSTTCFNVSNCWLVYNIKHNDQEKYNKAEAFVITIYKFRAGEPIIAGCDNALQYASSFQSVCKQLPIGLQAVA